MGKEPIEVAMTSHLGILPDERREEQYAYVW
jgi:hypothetical protein